MNSKRADRSMVVGCVGTETRPSDAPDLGQSWLALSGQVSAVNEWNLCRLPLWAGIFGVARREGVARPE
jgi:hypothetical protein